MNKPGVEERLNEVLALGGIPTIYKCENGNYAVRTAYKTYYGPTLLGSLELAVAGLRGEI